MGSQPIPSASRVVFGPFEFDSVSGDLRKLGTRIRLQGKPLQILTLLTERPGQLLTREELQRHLWAGTTFVDFEQGLNAAVNKLRQALGDSAGQPRYIETLPGRGYRFIGPIQRSAKLVLEMAPPASRTSPSRRSWLPWTAGLALLAAALAGFWMGSRSTSTALKPSRFTVSPPAGFALEGASSRQAFALSPDGTSIAFTAMDASGTLSIFLRKFSSLDTRLLPESQGAHTMFWSPDSRSLFFTARGQLRRAWLNGNPQVILSRSPAFLFSGAWLSPEKLLLSRKMNSFTISPSGGQMESVAGLYCWPQTLPGAKLLYTVWDEKAARHRAHLASVNDLSSSTGLLEADSRVMYMPSARNRGTGHLFYVRSGALLAQPFHLPSAKFTGEAIPIVSKLYSFFPTGAADFSVSDNGSIAYMSYSSRSQLAWVDRQGRQLSTIGPAGINVKSGRLSPDGRRLVAAIYDVQKGYQNLWLFDTASGAGRLITPAVGLRDGPVWSPDSARLAYMLNPDGARPPGIALRGAGENHPETFLGTGDFQLPTDWSPDGRFLLFANTGIPLYSNETQSDAWLLDLARGNKTIPLLNSPFHEANAVFSPDGRWLAFTSNESGRSELYIQSLHLSDSPKMAGERHLVSRAGALAVRWRRDGKEIYYLGWDGRVHAVPVTLSPKPTFGASQALFTIGSDARANIHSLTGFDVSPHGRRFLIPITGPGEPPSIIVIQNWEAATP